MKSIFFILLIFEEYNKFEFINTDNIHSALLSSIKPIPPILQARLKIKSIPLVISKHLSKYFKSACIFLLLSKT